MTLLNSLMPVRIPVLFPHDIEQIGPMDPIWLVALQLTIGGAFMTALGSGIESWGEVRWTPSFVGTLLFISVFVIAIGWLVFYKLMDGGEAGKIASYTFLIPHVAIFAGTLFLHEPFTLSLLVGLVLILLSIYFVNRTDRFISHLFDGKDEWNLSHANPLSHEIVRLVRTSSVIGNSSFLKA